MEHGHQFLQFEVNSYLIPSELGSVVALALVVENPARARYILCYFATSNSYFLD